MSFKSFRAARYALGLGLLCGMAAGCRGQQPQGPVKLSLQEADLAAIPSSQRSLYADVEGTKNIKVNWTVTGGCTLASSTTNGVPQIVTAPAKGASCSIGTAAPTNLEPSFHSEVSCKVTATSVADPAQSASIVIPVCNPAVTLTVFPASTVLFKKQYAVIQSALRGSVQTGVRWQIVKNPGGAGSLSGGDGNRHAIFSATAPGTYLLKATSVADPSKTAESTIYVTEHDLPAPNTDHTEMVDCTAVEGGHTYEVGPSQQHKDLNDINWSTLKPGDTVRVHNEDTTGKAPTEYHQRIKINSSGTPGHPIRICGVPDAKGVKPILDGTDATTRDDANWYVEDLTILEVEDKARRLSPLPNQNAHVAIEGLHIRNVNPSVRFTPNAKAQRADKGPSMYHSAGACVRVDNGRDVLIRGNELEACPQGVFTNARTPEGSMVYDLTVEGNSFQSWGWIKTERVHGQYLQALGMQVQFNYYGPASNEAFGNAIKTRSVLQFIRWNYLQQADSSTGRALDMVEPQAFACYITPYGFSWMYHSHGEKNDCGTPGKGPQDDPVTADEVAANFEAYHSDYVYGNIIDRMPGGPAFVHYGYDQGTKAGPGYFRRGGVLYSWNNTHYLRKGDGSRSPVKEIFDPAAPDGFHSYEFPRIESINNIFAADPGNTFQWTRMFWAEINVNSNWLTGTAGLPSRSARDSYQTLISLQDNGCDQWGSCAPNNGNMHWQRGGKPGTMAATLYTGTIPFNTHTFLPEAKVQNLSTAVPQAIQDQPSNMEYLPATNEIRFRPTQTTLGALQ